MSILDQIIAAESGGNAAARNPRSSATGLGQFIDSTWLSTLAQHRPDLLEGRTRQQALALRLDPDVSREMLARHTEDNQRGLRAAGIDPTPGNTYLAHFAGLGGARKIAAAPGDADVEGILGRRVVAANPFLRGMTASELMRWSHDKATGQKSNPAARHSQGSDGQADDGMSEMRAMFRQLLGARDDGEAISMIDGVLAQLGADEADDPAAPAPEMTV